MFTKHQNFAGLSNEIKQFIGLWSNGNRSISTLISVEAQNIKDHVTSESSRIIERFDSGWQANTAHREREDLQTRFLSTFWFPEMNARENNIKEASEDTVRWIFVEENSISESFSESGDSSDTDSDTQSQDEHPTQFRKWLESTGSIFWILGKPGSSKSTVVKFLVRNRQTLEYLGKWRQSVLICRFFFIESCTNPLQRQLRGCLRALLHQVVSSKPYILDKLLYSRPELSGKQSEHDWSIEELGEVLLEALRADDDSAFCLFLDGLDEIEVRSDDRVSTIELVKRLSDLPNVKICVSSRPDNIFTQVIRSCSYRFLKTEALTHCAIKAYVTKQLIAYKNSPLSDDDHWRYKEIINELVDKAEGVFLWVALATRSILRGIINGDSWDILHKRTKELEPDLDSLFRQMLIRQHADQRHYPEETSRILWHALQTRSEPIMVTVWGSIIGTHETLHSKVLENFDAQPQEWPIAKEIQLTQEYERWLFSRSMGLLEIVQEPREEHREFPLFRDNVQFIHRSVQEFLQNTKDGHRVLLASQESSRQRLLTALEAIKYLCYDLVGLSSRFAKIFSPGTYSYPKPLHNYVTSMAVLTWLGYISATEELELFLHFKSLIQSRYASKFPDIDFFNVAAKCGIIGFLSLQQSQIFEPLSSREKNELLYTIAIQYGFFNDSLNSDTISLEKHIFEKDPDWPTRMDLSRLCGLSRKIVTIRWLLRAGASPNVRAHVADIGGFPIEINPFSAFLFITIWCLNRVVWQNKENECYLQVVDCINEFEQYGSDFGPLTFFLDQTTELMCPTGPPPLYASEDFRVIFEISPRFFLKLLHRVRGSTAIDGKEVQNLHDISTADFVQCTYLRVKPKSKGIKCHGWRVPNPKANEKRQHLEAIIGEQIWKNLTRGWPWQLRSAGGSTREVLVTLKELSFGPSGDPLQEILEALYDYE